MSTNVNPIQYVRCAGALVGLLATSHVLAAPVMIDFTDSRWSGASGQSSYSQTYGSLDVMMYSSLPESLTFNAGGPASGGGLALDGDGIGIGDDEIGQGANEALHVAFSSAVTILGYYFLDFFGEEGPNGEGESAHVAVTGGSGVDFLDNGSATDGIGFYGREQLELIGSTMISFSAVLNASHLGYLPFSDFALAGILVDDNSVAVPEPATSGLLGLGLLGLLFASRRRTSNRRRT